jgi:hypothetical protein
MTEQAQLPRVFVDFHNSDRQGRVRLNTVGTVQDLNRLGVVLREGTEILLYSYEVETDGLLTPQRKDYGWQSSIRTTCEICPVIGNRVGRVPQMTAACRGAPSFALFLYFCLSAGKIGQAPSSGSARREPGRVAVFSHFFARRVDDEAMYQCVPNPRIIACKSYIHLLGYSYCCHGRRVATRCKPPLFASALASRSQPVPMLFDKLTKLTPYSGQ